MNSVDLVGLKDLAARLAEDVASELNARAASAREPSAVVLLRGEMGAGKTQFTRFFIEALGVGDKESLAVASPSFALHHRYPTRRARVDHFDLYRLESVEELESIAFWDFFRREKPPVARIALIEWAERLAELGAEAQLPRAWAKWALDFAEDPQDPNRRFIKVAR